MKVPRDNFDPPIIFAIGRWFCRMILEDLFHYEVFGEENVPHHGPCLIVANHASFLDPPAAVIGGRRCTFSFARKTLFRKGVWAWMFERFLTIPVDLEGGNDLGAIRTVIKLLRENQSVLLFPEGSRSPDGQLQPPKRGAAMVAALAQVPVVPAYIDGTFAAFNRQKKWPNWFSPVRVVYGKALLPDAYDPGPQDPQRYVLISQFLMERIAQLKTFFESGRTHSPRRL
ncbi:MAG: 1-acyl-sn-glycerol-3-phosphate acyltransferase [Puniceicoccales bacterium]|jgi:1-acyl-sn-glycerol-3-phosphate acyltransferase|nr:1-acyl-sn-glycerol-3-phosphate acyltransferase [Puniceicoccales bacterium]